MKPGYWIGIMALVGAVLGYAVFKLTGWLDARIGMGVGFIIGLALYARSKDRFGKQ